MTAYHPYITGANRNLRAVKGVNVFAPGTDPAGLGTLGAPVNPAHMFDYIGENLPAFGNPQAVVGADAAGFEAGFEQVYGGKIITAERDRFNPNTTTYHVQDADPVVSRPDELTEVKNNAQIMAEKTKLSVRTYATQPKADLLAAQVNADAEMRDLHKQAVGLAYESQMDAIRANHLAAKSRGAALRGDNIGALQPLPRPTLITLKPVSSQALVSANVPSLVVSAPAAAAPAAAQPETADFVQMTLGSSDPVSSAPIFDDSAAMGTYVDTRFEPTKMALILGGVAAAAVAAFFLMRK